MLRPYDQSPAFREHQYMLSPTENINTIRRLGRHWRVYLIPINRFKQPKGNFQLNGIIMVVHTSQPNQGGIKRAMSFKQDRIKQK